MGFFYLAGIRDTSRTDLKYFFMSRSKSEKQDLDSEHRKQGFLYVFLYSCSVHLYTTQVNLLIRQSLQSVRFVHLLSIKEELFNKLKALDPKAYPKYAFIRTVYSV